MNRKSIAAFTAAFGIAAAASIAAQAGGQSDRADQAAGTITLVGCLQRADTSRTAGTSTTAATHGAVGTRGAEQYVLLGGSGPNASGTAAPEHSGQRSNVVRGSWYAITGNADDLRARVDHRVEVTGTIDTAGSVVGTSASVTDGPSGTIHASSIKVINDTCNQQEREKP